VSYLNPIEEHEFWTVVMRAVQQNGKAALVATDKVREIPPTVDKVVILDAGSVAAVGSIRNVMKLHSTGNHKTFFCVN